MSPAPILGHNFRERHMSYAHRCAALFVLSGCVLGALLGLLYDVAVTRRRHGEG